ncbi:MAG: hypothetical protein KatS3mg005_1359 [Bryobacteraceae bacterium]|nr:MAG: hypothetical protein KatS3mg005_1359 [Bryobacteraceae bacterium]
MAGFHGRYNHNVTPARWIVSLALALLAGCSKNIQTNEAVRAGVIKHLSQNSGLNLSQMDIEVTSVTFRDNEADAVVGFKPKGGGAASGMSMRYTLERQGNEWVVKKKADSGMGHGMMPPSGEPPAGEGQLPPGHPPVSGEGAERKQ